MIAGYEMAFKKSYANRKKYLKHIQSKKCYDNERKKADLNKKAAAKKIQRSTIYDIDVHI